MLSPNTHRVWKNHKYIRKEGNRYIYPEDLKRMQRSRDGKLVRTITDANGNRIQVRGAAATNTIANRSNRYDRSSGERMSPSEYRTRQQDGSLDRMRGQTIQEAAKKQGQYSVNMMRQEKAAQQRPVQKEGKLVRTINDVNGNQVRIRGAAATNTIANRSNRYNKVSGERTSSSTSSKGTVQDQRNRAVNNQGTVNYRQLGQQRANRAAAANGVKELYRMDNGSYFREHGRSDQEFAKQNGQYTINKMRQEKAARQKQSAQSQNVSTAAKQAMERAGYNGPIARPQNQHVATKKKVEEKKEEQVKTEEKQSSLLSSLNDTKEEDDKKTSKSSSTKSSSGSSSSGSSKSSGNSGSSSSSGSSKSSSSSGSTKENKGTVTTPVGVYRGGTSSGKASSSKKSSKSSKGGSSSNASSSDADMELNKNNEEKTKAEELDNILQENMDLKTMSESSIKSIADKLGDVLDIGKTESKIQGKTKLSDAKSLVSRGLSILKSFKSK